MTRIQSRAIAATLANDEASTDAELMEYFTTEIGISAAEAEKCLAQRNDYLAAA